MDSYQVPMSALLSLLQRLGHDRRAAIAITFSLAIAFILGMVGLGVEAGSWYSTKRDMQNAADLAAESGINSIKNTSSAVASTITTNAYNEAKSASAIHGFANGSNGVTVTPATPPTTGSYTASTYLNKALEVTVSKPGTRLFSSLFLGSDPMIQARAVAMIVNGGDCMLATSPTSSKAISVTGNVTVSVDCGIADNSNASDALYMQGGATLTTITNLTVNGSFDHTGNAYTLSYGSGNIGHGATITDPYASTNFPSLNPSCSNCTQVSLASLTALTGTSGTFSGGGVFTGPLTVSGTLTLSNGVYYIDGGNLTVKNATLTTSNATIILTSSTGGANIGTLQMDSNGVMTLVAPTSSSSPTQGIAIMQDPSVSAGSTDNHMQSNPTLSVTGAMYFPRGKFSMLGTPNWASTACTQIIAYTFDLQGDPGVSDTNCTGAGAKEFGPGSVKLVE